MNPRSMLVLTHELPPLGGGAGRAMAQLCAALGELGIGIEVWTQKPPAAARRDFPFRVRYFATGRTVQFQTNVATILIYAARILFSGLMLGKRKPDLILSNTAIPTGCVGAFLGRMLGAPHVIWYHGADVHGNRTRGAGLAYRLMLKAAWRNTALHCFVSKGLLAMAEGYGGMRTPRMVLPLFADHVAPGEPAVPAVRDFLFAGRLEKVKDPFLFLRAIGMLKDGGRLPADVRFRIVGGGALFAPLRDRIRASGLASLVSLEPPVPGDAMGRIYGEAYALVLTSVVEGYPLTILEAARCGVPSLGPDTLGINEELENGRTGLLFAPYDAGACAAAMLRLLDDGELRASLGRNARAAALGMSSRKSAALFAAAVGELSGNGS
jgi:glycosyltransferase involved in cell wall biosynthesis